MTKRRLAFLAFVGFAVLALCWPGQAWFASRIEPYVLGMPFSLAWVVGWVVASFVALAAYHVTGDDPGEDD